MVCKKKKTHPASVDFLLRDLVIECIIYVVTPRFNTVTYEIFYVSRLFQRGENLSF